MPLFCRFAGAIALPMFVLVCVSVSRGDETGGAADNTPDKLSSEDRSNQLRVFDKVKAELMAQITELEAQRRMLLEEQAVSGESVPYGPGEMFVERPDIPGSSQIPWNVVQPAGRHHQGRALGRTAPLDYPSPAMAQPRVDRRDGNRSVLGVLIGRPRGFYKYSRRPAPGIYYFDGRSPYAR